MFGQHVLPPFLPVAVNKLGTEFGVVQHSQPVGFGVLLAFGPFGLAVVILKAKELDEVFASISGESVASDFAGHVWIVGGGMDCRAVAPGGPVGGGQAQWLMWSWRSISSRGP